MARITATYRRRLLVEQLGAQLPVELVEDKTTASDEPRVLPYPCPRCGGRMLVIEVFARGGEPRYGPTPAPARSGSTRHDGCSDCAPQSHRLARRSSPGDDQARLAGLILDSCQPPGESSTPLPLAQHSFIPLPAVHPDQSPLAQSTGPMMRAAAKSHRTRCIAAAPPPAISCLGASRTPAVGACVDSHAIQASENLYRRRRAQAQAATVVPRISVPGGATVHAYRESHRATSE
jgi:hypothetical protein